MKSTDWVRNLLKNGAGQVNRASSWCNRPPRPAMRVLTS
jgi:hypothetical protein